MAAAHHRPLPERTAYQPKAMVKKKAFLLRIDAGLYKALEKWAADEFRSTNGQIEWALREALKQTNRLPKKK